MKNLMFILIYILTSQIVYSDEGNCIFHVRKILAVSQDLTNSPSSLDLKNLRESIEQDFEEIITSRIESLSGKTKAAVYEIINDESLFLFDDNLHRGKLAELRISNYQIAISSNAQGKISSFAAYIHELEHVIQFVSRDVSTWKYRLLDFLSFRSQTAIFERGAFKAEYDFYQRLINKYNISDLFELLIKEESVSDELKSDLKAVMLNARIGNDFKKYLGMNSYHPNSLAIEGYLYDSVMATAHSRILQANQRGQRGFLGANLYSHPAYRAQMQNEIINKTIYKSILIIIGIMSGVTLVEYNDFN